MSEDNFNGETPSDVPQAPQSSEGSPQQPPINDENSHPENLLEPGTSDLQRQRTEALERILLASDSQLSLPQSPGLARRLRFGGARRLALGAQQRSVLNRRLISRDELERAIFIPVRSRSAISGVNMSSISQDPTRTIRNLIESRNLEEDRRSGDNGSNAHSRINVGTFFMELTYSTDPHQFHHLFKNSTETQRRRMEVHAANTMSLIKHYCPVKQNKLNQFRCCVKTQRQDLLDFKNFEVKQLDSMDPSQIRCRTGVIVIARNDSEGKWGNPCTPYLLLYLNKKHISPTCITFQSEVSLNTLLEHLKDLHVFPAKSNVHDSTFTRQAKRFLVMSTLGKLLETWNSPVLVLDSCPSKIIDVDCITEFARRFQIKTFEIECEEGGSSKQWKAVAKRVGSQVRAAITQSNIAKIRNDMEKRTRANAANNSTGVLDINNKKRIQINPAMISEDCFKIVSNLHERMSSLQEQTLHLLPEKAKAFLKGSSTLSLLEDGILADIENSSAFKCQHVSKKYSNSSRIKCDSSRGSLQKTARYRDKSEMPYSASGEKEIKSARPRTSYSQSEEDILFPSSHFTTALVRDQEKVSELLFNELNQRWRIHGPQRFIPSGLPDAGPYCDNLTDSERQLILSVLHEVTNFEMLKDIRNELKDSKKDLEGRLYGYSPDFSNLIASAEEFLHGKASCMEPCMDEMEFYKMPVSLVFSEAEVKYMKAKPPVYVVAAESPGHTIKTAIEESTKLFLDAVLHTACGTRKVPFSRRSKTRAIVVVEDNNEVLELLTVALWFFEKTPLATFQAKYCHNTDSFLLSLDACRFYFGTYPAYSTRKDEHIFERWLGVGMNGILRSHQSKILLIDFPRPGMVLQKTRNVLFNRLKIEERLHNIKSFMAGKPSRKEDNLSTVEHILDEIQKCLEPRDKLLFRKSRRMYMDLKLYKQIEQKSRQDMKSLREWGLPEPENEHDLWERLQDAELVINNPIPRSQSILAESCRISEVDSVHSCECDISVAGNILSDEDIVESVTSTNYKDTACDLRTDEDDDSTLGDNMLSTNHDAEPMEELDESCDNLCHDGYYDESLHTRKYLTASQAGESNNSNWNGNSLGTEEANTIEEPDCDINLKIVKPFLFPNRLITNNQESEEQIRYCLESSSESIDEFKKSNDSMKINNSSRVSARFHETDAFQKGKSFRGDPFNSQAKESQGIDIGYSKDQRNKSLKRTPGFINLLDENIFTNKNETQIVNKKFGSISITQADSETSDMDSSKAYTRLEFTLAPKMTSGESSTSPSNTSILRQQEDKLNEEVKVTGILSSHGSNFDVAVTRSEIQGKRRKPFRNRSLHAKCVAHISKWGKSFSQMLRRRRVFPERHLQSASSRPSSSLEDKICRKDLPQRVQICSLDTSSESVNNFTSRQHSGWFSSVVRLLRRRAGKRMSKDSVDDNQTKENTLNN